MKSYNEWLMENYDANSYIQQLQGAESKEEFLEMLRDIEAEVGVTSPVYQTMKSAIAELGRRWGVGTGGADAAFHRRTGGRF